MKLVRLRSLGQGSSGPQLELYENAHTEVLAFKGIL